MASIPPPFAPRDRMPVFNAAAPGGDLASLLALRETQVIHKRTRWTIFALKPTDETTERMYDELWAVLGDEKRHLSVARNAGAMWAVLYKGDEKVAALAGISAHRAVYEIRKPLGGGAARNAVANFGRVWFASSSEHTSDFDLSPDDEDVPMEAVYEDVAELTDRQHLFRLGNAKQKRPHERTPHEKALVAGKSEINALRAMDTREAKAVAEKRRDPCYRRVTSEGLHMPADFVGVGEWRGKTWDPETRTMKKVSFLEYLDTEMHLERTAVLYSDAGSGKTPALNATARTFAMRYQDADPYYLSAGTVDGFKAAYRKGLVKRGVPRVIEDFRPLGNPNGNRQKFEEYIVNLLNVKDGGSVDTAGGMQMTFPPTTPQLVSTNDKFGRWIEGFERLPREKRHAIFKRVVFFTVPDAPLVKAELRKRRQDDLRSVVAAGKRREREFLIGRLATTPSTTASAASVGDSEESDFEPFPGGESAPVTPPVAPARTPDSDGGSEDESATSPPPLVAEEELIGRSAAPFGPDAGKPLFARLPTFVAVYLVFASDVLARLGEIDREVFEHYLAELRELDPSAADAYSGTCHCTVSFLTDTTTLKLLKAWLNDGEITEDALYNVVIGQTVLPSWRRLEALGPFRVSAPVGAEEFAAHFRAKFPAKKAVVPSHLKRGVLGLLGKGSEVENCGRFIHDLAAKIPAALARIRRGEALPVLEEDLGMPHFRALLAARLLSVVDPAVYDFDRRDIGDYAQLGLWLLVGLPTDEARAATADAWTDPAVDALFAKLMEALPEALASMDNHGIVDRLSRLHLLPLCAQNVEHMLCEFRKMVLPEHRATRGPPFEGYAELWRVVAPLLARRAALREA